MKETEMTPLIIQEQRGNVLEIIFNRPEKKNALTLPMYQQATACLQQAADNTDIHVVMLRGEGSSFCAGNDIQDFVAAVDNREAMQIILTFLHTLAAYPKPIIAAVQGDAVGIGTTMLLHCDLVIAADDLRGRMPFVHLGLVPEGGSTLLLPRMLGQRQAFALLVEGELFDATRAERLGIVNNVAATADLLHTARVRAERLAAMPAGAVQSAKRLMRQPELEALNAVIKEEGSCFYERLFSDEARQALLAFLQKSS